MRPDKRLAAPQRPSFAEALRFWFKLGWISFGGTAAHIAIMQDELVEKKRWISNGMFFHALSHCMILPGPEAQQLAIYIGWKLHGKRGGIVAGTLFVLPSLFVLLALSVIYVRLGSLPWIAAMFNGLKPVVIALVIVALQRVARRALCGPVQGAIAVATFAAMFFFDVSLLVVMFGAIVLGIVLGALWPGLLHRSAEAAAGDDEESYYIHRRRWPRARSFSGLCRCRSSTFLSATSIFGETSHYSSGARQRHPAHCTVVPQTVPMCSAILVRCPNGFTPLSKPLCKG